MDKKSEISNDFFHMNGTWLDNTRIQEGQNQFGGLTIASTDSLNL
jgi:hypothetical protein